MSGEPFIVGEKVALTPGDAALLDLPPKPFIMSERASQKIERDLIHGAPTVGRQACQLGLEFSRNVKINGASVGWWQAAVNECLDRLL